MMHLERFCKALLATILFLYGCVGQQRTEYELENGLGTGWPMDRPGASGQTSRSMRTNGWIKFKVCTSETVGITVADVFYSNDGPADRMAIYVNNNKIGTFNSEKTEGGTGQFWDVFKSSGPVGSEIPLFPGEHTIEVKVEAADYYGVDLDKIVIQTNKPIYEYDFWCGENPQVTQSSPSTPTLAGSSTVTSAEPSSTKSAEGLPQTSTLSTPSTPTSSAAETTASSLPHPEKNIFAEQLSFKSKCLDIPNVRVKFNPTSLKGVNIISEAAAIANKGTGSDVVGQGNNLRTCKNTLWQIGVADGQSTGTGPVSEAATVDYHVAKGENEPAFPASINPAQSDKLLLRYVTPADVSLQDSVLYFTVGLAEIDKDVKIGVQYYDAKQKGFSNTQFITFKPKQRVIGWELPASAASSTGENKILVIFDKAATTPIKFDFLRLDLTPEDAKLENKFLINRRRQGFRIVGSQYKSLKNQPRPQGMSVSIGAGKKMKNVAKLSISHNRMHRNAGPVKNNLTIYDNGKIFPLHENRNSLKLSSDADGKTFKDVSGIVLGDPNNPITDIRILLRRSQIVITYADKTSVRLFYRPEYGQTRLMIIDSTLKNNTIEFLSTHVTDYMAAVNDIRVDNNITKPVMDNLDNIKGEKFVFAKTSPNPMFHASAFYGIIFPKNVIPK